MMWLRTGFLIIGFSVFALIISACSPPMVTEPDISISGAWVRLPPAGRDITGGYFVIENTGAADVLLSVSSPTAGSIEMHHHVQEDGMMQMREVPRIEVPANGPLVFQPGGYHLMMFGVSGLQQGQQINLLLDFEKSGQQSTIAIVGKQGSGQ